MPDLEDETEEATLVATKTIIRQRAEDHKAIYANNAQVHTSVYDINFDLAQILEVRDDAMVVEDRVRVFMSPAHAKALATLLLGAVATYENQFGPLPITVRIPPSLERLIMQGAESSENNDETTPNIKADR